MKEIKKEYIKFVLNYKPFTWEVRKKDKRENIKNKHSFEIGFIRFFKVFELLKKLNTRFSKPKIIDVGAFPGNMIKLSKEVFNDYNDYTAVGLDLDKEFVDKVKKYDVKCIDTEIDPNFPDAKNTKAWNLNNFDICYLLDTIEHLVDPIFCLEKINKSLKPGGYLIITTDNITNFFYIFRMITKGDSPNVHPILSSMFFKGNHRPHNKEYSKGELKFLLNHTGFEIERHEYFDRMQGEFSILNNKLKKNNLNLSIKGIIKFLLKKIFYFFPHFNNHQIILAKKIENIDEMTRPGPTSSEEKWMELRQKTIGY